jgi:glutaredoxin
VKEFLSQAGYAFDARNVDEDHNAYDDLIALGARSVPATVIGSHTITGFDPARLREALAAASGESSADR